MPDGAASSRPLLVLKDLNAKELGIELTTLDGNETLEISAVKQWRTRFLEGRTELGDDLRSRRPVNSDLT